MAMFLARVPVETIQLIGRWKSRTFMRYIQIQVPDITKNIASKMTLRESFFTITTDEPSRRQTEIGGNQVNAQQQQSQTPNNSKAQSPPEVDQLLVGPDSDATYRMLAVP